MKKRFIKGLVCILSLSGLMCSCNKENNDNTFTSVELESCGSTSVEKVVTALSNKLKDLTNNKISMKLDQHGSGDAVSGVTVGKNNKKYDIGFLSREIKDSELVSLSDSNIKGSICKDAVVAIVNSENDYKETTAKELTSIYKGEVKSWNNLSSISGNINLYTREAGSGTRECFFEGIGYSTVKAEDKWEDNVNPSSQSSNGSMMNAIKQDKYAIGYCSLDSLSSASGIKGLSFEGVEANETNVLNGTYTLSRNFNYVIRGDYEESDKNKVIALNAFIDFMSTKEGVAVIKGAGGIVSSSTNLKSWSEVQKEKYPELN